MARRALERGLQAREHDPATQPPLRDLLATSWALLWSCKRAAPSPAIEVTIADALGRKWRMHWDGQTHTWLSCSTRPCQQATRRVLDGLFLRWPRDRLDQDDWRGIGQPLMYKGQWQSGECPERHRGAMRSKSTQISARKNKTQRPKITTKSDKTSIFLPVIWPRVFISF